MDTLQIPNKSLFKLNEVCGLTGVKPYVLRFWESEFSEISPVLSSSGQKLYEHKDIEAIAIIKKFLFEDKLTIEETKKELSLKLTSCEIIEGETEEESALNNPSFSEREGLDKIDIEKLVMAKNQLHRLLNLTSDIQKKHYWN